MPTAKEDHISKKSLIQHNMPFVLMVAAFVSCIILGIAIGCSLLIGKHNSSLEIFKRPLFSGVVVTASFGFSVIFAAILAITLSLYWMHLKMDKHKALVNRYSKAEQVLKSSPRLSKQSSPSKKLSAKEVLDNKHKELADRYSRPAWMPKLSLMLPKQPSPSEELSLEELLADTKKILLRVLKIHRLEIADEQIRCLLKNTGYTKTLFRIEFSQKISDILSGLKEKLHETDIRYNGRPSIEAVQNTNRVNRVKHIHGLIKKKLDPTSLAPTNISGTSETPAVAGSTVQWKKYINFRNSVYMASMKAPGTHLDLLLNVEQQLIDIARYVHDSKTLKNRAILSGINRQLSNMNSLYPIRHISKNIDTVSCKTLAKDLYREFYFKPDENGKFKVKRSTQIVGTYKRRQLTHLVNTSIKLFQQPTWETLHKTFMDISIGFFVATTSMLFFSFDAANFLHSNTFSITGICITSIFALFFTSVIFAIASNIVQNNPKEDPNISKQESQRNNPGTAFIVENIENLRQIQVGASTMEMSRN